MIPSTTPDESTAKSSSAHFGTVDSRIQIRISFSNKNTCQYKDVFGETDSLGRLVVSGPKWNICLYQEIFADLFGFNDQRYNIDISNFSSEIQSLL